MFIRGGGKHFGGIDEVRSYCNERREPVMGMGPGKPLSKGQRKAMGDWLKGRRSVFKELLDALELGRRE